VRPPIKERMAVAEHEINDLNSLYATLYEQITMAANHDEVRERFHEFDRELNRRFESVHKRIDIEVNPAIHGLQHKRVIRDWAVSISLAITIVYSIVLTIKNWPL
jgi:hypothetical protein